MNIIPPNYTPITPVHKRSIKRATASDHSHESGIHKDRRTLPDRRHRNAKGSNSVMDLRQSGDRRHSNRVYIST